MNNTYFTSDLHLNHNNVRTFCPRFRSHFKSLEDMNEGLIEVWNNTIDKDDDVYNLGDVVFGKNIQEIENLLKRLNGRHHLILGNHDKRIRNNTHHFLRKTKDDGNPLLSSINDFLRLDYVDRTLILMHYPCEEWEGSHRGFYHLCGHIHDKMPKTKGRILNIGFDLHGKILSLEDVDDYLKDLPSESRFGTFKGSTDLEKNKELIKQAML